MTEEKKQINVLLSMDTVDELDAVKGHYGLQTNSDAIRYLIRQEYRSICLNDAFKFIDAQRVLP